MDLLLPGKATANKFMEKSKTTSQMRFSEASIWESFPIFFAFTTFQLISG